MQEIAMRWLIKHLISKMKFSSLGSLFPNNLTGLLKEPHADYYLFFSLLHDILKDQVKNTCQSNLSLFLLIKINILPALNSSKKIITIVSVNSMECQVISLCIVTSRDINTILPTAYNHCSFYYLQNVMCAYGISQNKTMKTRTLSQTA